MPRQARNGLLSAVATLLLVVGLQLAGLNMPVWLWAVAIAVFVGAVGMAVLEKVRPT